MSKLFLGGLPTGPDLRKLKESIDLSPGETVSYERLAEVLQLDARSRRFAVVLNAWRKDMRRAQNIDTAVVRAVGIRRLPEAERVTAAAGDFVRGVRVVRRSFERLDAVPMERLTEAERNTATHARRVIEASFLASREATKQIATAFAPPKTLPRLVPPGVAAKKDAG